MKQINADNINKIFRALESQISIFGGQTVSLVVCGGTALTALGLVSRTTKDVDVLGLAKEPGNEGIEVQRIRRFPEFLEKAAEKVERDFGLQKNWLNLGPAPQVDTGLPDGLTTRLVKRDFGRYLTVYFISRLDQIHFKLYAAVDRDDYHTEDLLKLKPTQVEIEMASRWIVTQDVSEPFKFGLKEFLKEHGFEDVTDKF